jgi:hypothetical protein
MFRFGVFLPDLIEDPSSIFDPQIDLVEVELKTGRLFCGFIFGGIYLLLYISFVIGHTPRAKPVQDEISIVRYTEPSRYVNDKISSFQWWLFYPVIWINCFVVILYILNAIGIVATLGWTGTPLVVRWLILFCFLPFAMGLLDGLVRCNFSSLWNMTTSAVFALPLMTWFTIWLPAYATTRLSDLTWGNRERKSIDETESSLKRAENGQRVASLLVLFNSLVAISVIILMQFYGRTFSIFVMSYTLILSATYVVSFVDIAYRILACSTQRSGKEDESDKSDGTAYTTMDEDLDHESGWCSSSSLNCLAKKEERISGGCCISCGCYDVEDVDDADGVEVVDVVHTTDAIVYTKRIRTGVSRSDLMTDLSTRQDF